MPGIQRSKSAGLIRPTTRTQIGKWAATLTDVTPAQIWDFIGDAELTPSRTSQRLWDPAVDYDPKNRDDYLVSTLGKLDNSDPSQIRKFMAVLEECLLATNISNASARLATALKLDGYTIDHEGNILDPVSADLFRLDLSTIEDASSITQQISRIQRDLHTSPGEAIDASCALVAAALKLLIKSHRKTTTNDKLPSLAKEAKPILKPYYESIGLKKDDANQIVQGLVTVINGVAPIRNTHSPTHPETTAKSSDPQAAELLVSAAMPVVRAALGAIKAST